MLLEEGMCTSTVYNYIRRGKVSVHVCVPVCIYNPPVTHNRRIFQTNVVLDKLPSYILRNF